MTNPHVSTKTNIINMPQGTTQTRQKPQMTTPHTQTHTHSHVKKKLLKGSDQIQLK